MSTFINTKTIQQFKMSIKNLKESKYFENYIMYRECYYVLLFEILNL